MSETPLAPAHETGPEPEPRGPKIPAAATAAALYAVLFVLGLVLGAIGAFEHTWYLGRDIPIAAIVSLMLLFAVVHGLGRLARSRLAAAVTALAWGLVSTALLAQRPAGDLVFTDDTASQIYVYGGFAVLLAAVVLVPAAPGASGSWLLRSPIPGSK
ncbi:DUF6113 family protein [Sinosporangium album]|nr:DUF6113 family protein [Sinosporangium album]